MLARFFTVVLNMNSEYDFNKPCTRSKRCSMVMSSLPLNTLLGYEASDKRLDILRRISHTGSISEAARSAGVSYKAAWQAIETLTNLAGTPLVEKAVGGSGGGGAIVTAAGHR